MRVAMPSFRISCRASTFAMALIAALLANGAQSAEVRVAVAANFTEAANEIGAVFERATGHRPILIFGSTGQLYAQIVQGAPFEVFLAADQAAPARAVEAGLAVAGSRFTYATGRIVLYSLDTQRVEGPATLRSGAFSRLAIANPETAPYGVAAIETLRALGVYEALQAKIVRGNNISQAYQFVATGNAEIGFVSLSQVALHDDGSRWVVPADLHAPIAQDAVLLTRGEHNTAAIAFMAFLKGPEARAVAEKFGYGPGD